MDLPPTKQRGKHEVHFNEYITDEDGDSNALLASSTMDDYLLLADEALVTVCRRAQPLLLTKAEVKAEAAPNDATKIATANLFMRPSFESEPPF